MNNKFFKKVFILVSSIVILFLPLLISKLYAHPIDLNNVSKADIGWTYLIMGFTHIIP